MSNFDKWLKETATELSGEEPFGRAPNLGRGGNLERVRQGLRRRIEKNELYFRIAFGLAVLLAVATLVAPFLPHAAGRPWVSAAFGISSAGAVAFALNAVRDKNTFEVMLELGTGLGDAGLKEVLGVLTRKVAGGKSTSFRNPIGRGASTR